MRTATDQERQEYIKTLRDLIAKIREARCGGVGLIDARDLIFAKVGVKTVSEYMEHYGVYVKTVSSPTNPAEFFYYG